MAKAYWVATYRAVHDADKLAAYAKLAGPAIQGAGGKFLARGNPAKTYENGLSQRCVVIEFDSVAAATGGARFARLQGRARRARQRGGPRHPHHGRRLT